MAQFTDPPFAFIKILFTNLQVKHNGTNSSEQQDHGLERG